MTWNTAHESMWRTVAAMQAITTLPQPDPLHAQLTSPHPSLVPVRPFSAGTQQGDELANGALQSAR